MTAYLQLRQQAHCLLSKRILVVFNERPPFVKALRLESVNEAEICCLWDADRPRHSIVAILF